MKTTLTLLVASVALTAAIGVPAWGAMQPSADGGLRLIAGLFKEADQTMHRVLASGDDDHDDRPYRKSSRRGHDDDDDDGRSGGGAGNPAPAGTVAPPQNGLFGSDAPPQVQMN